MSGRMLIGRPLLVRLVDEQTNKEELLGDDEDFDEAEEAAASANMLQHRKTIEADAAAAPGKRSTKADQIAAIKAKLAAMQQEDEGAAKAAKRIGGERYKPY
jgi:hypothetical protein